MTTDTVPGVAQFQHGDLVFAKVKGYPFWPARIDCVRLEKCRKKRQKNKPDDQNSYWPIFFYGTHETLWINESDLRPFEENRSSLGLVHSKTRPNSQYNIEYLVIISNLRFELLKRCSIKKIEV